MPLSGRKTPASAAAVGLMIAPAWLAAAREIVSVMAFESTAGPMPSPPSRSGRGARLEGDADHAIDGPVELVKREIALLGGDLLGQDVTDGERARRLHAATSGEEEEG